MVRVLVAGGAGFIGSHLCDRLMRRSEIEKCAVVDNLWTGLTKNIAHIDDPRFHFVNSDIENFHSDHLFDEVYHLASPASPPWYMREPRRTISANVFGAMRLLDLLAPHGRFAFTSTSEVYGDPLVSPQPESYRGSVDCTGPRSSYDEAKRCTEALLFEMKRTNGLDIRIVRLFNVYGPRTRADDGRAVSNFIAQGLSNQPLTIFGGGHQSRSWGYVDDIVDGLERYFWRDDCNYAGPVNIGNNRETSVLDVAKYVSKCFGDLPIVHLDPVPQDPTNRCPDLTTVNSVLPNWTCRIPYEDGILLTIDWFKKNRQEAASKIAKRTIEHESYPSSARR
jgi:UDP-glucuronate decarboxylase